MSNLPAVQTAKLPASISRLLAAASQATAKELTGGVQSGFGILSYKGKVWSHRKGGVTVQFLDDDGNAMPSLDLILVRSSPTPAKTFYEIAYEDGSNAQPRCWSGDGLKPDAAVPHPVSKGCQSCPNNVWGSKVTPAGKKTRACSDVRRLAVVSLSDLDEKGGEATPVLLRVPPASLNPLKDYGEKQLDPKGIPYFAVVTRVGFNPQAAHPQLTFRAVRFLTEVQADAVLALRESADVKRILAVAEEFAGAPDGEVAEGAGVAAGSTAAAVPAVVAPKSPSAAKSKVRAASEEEAGLDILSPEAPQAVVEDPLAIGEPEAPAPKVAAPAPLRKPAPATPRKPAKPAATVIPVEKEETEIEVPAAAGAAAPPDFDAMLNALLGS